MSTVENVVQMPVRTKLVCSSCGASGEGSCRCGVPYVRPGERAEAAVKANPGKSDRAIAEEIGVNQSTVSRRRKKTTDASASVGERSLTAQNYAVDGKRIGRDGKARQMPRRKIPTDKLAAVARSRQQGKSQAEAAKEAGFASTQVSKLADAYQQGRSGLLDELNVDPETLAPTAKAKLEIAKRQMQKQMDAVLAKRQAELDEEVRLKVINGNKEYLASIKELEDKAWENEKLYRKLINDRKPIFTVEQFKLIRMCLHPDGERTKDKLNSAFMLFNSKSLLLTNEKV